MPYFISKPTSRELRERLKESTNNPRLRGVVRTLEEAHDVQRRLEREGEAFDKPFAVSGDSTDAKQADTDMKLRQGINPETGERLHRA